MTIMRKSDRMRAAIVAALAMAALAAGCGNNNSGSGGTTTTTGGTTPTAGGSGKTLQIAVIPKGTSHEYWKSLHAGANKAQQELATQGQKINIIWKGPEREDDRNGQINVVETFLSQQVDGIVLAPLDSHALAAPVEEAAKQHIPVVITDSSLEGTGFVSFVATDNEKGGELGGQRLIQVLGGKKRVLMMRYQQGSASTEEREAGFMKAMQAAPGIQMVSDDQYGGATVDTALKTSQNLLSRYGTQIDGIFTPNESTTRGMLLALKQAGLLGKVKLVGFDASPDLIQALQAGNVQGLVVQDPVKMGYLAVKTDVEAIQGKKVEPRIDTGVTMVTPDNMNTPTVNALLHPPLDQYLK